MLREHHFVKYLSKTFEQKKGRDFILMLNVNKVNKLDLGIFAFSPLFFFYSVLIFSAEFHEKIQNMFTHVAHIKVLILS